MGGVFRSVARIVPAVVGTVVGGPAVGAAIGGLTSLATGGGVKGALLGAGTTYLGGVGGGALASSLGGASAIGQMVGSALGSSAAPTESQLTAPPSTFAQSTVDYSFDSLRNKAMAETANAFVSSGIYGDNNRSIINNMNRRRLSSFINIYNRGHFPPIKNTQKRRRPV